MCKDEKDFGGLWFIIVLIVVASSVYATIMFGEVHKYPTMEQGVIELMKSDCKILQEEPCADKDKPHGKSLDATKNGK